jgi:hypothetical protein
MWLQFSMIVKDLGDHTHPPSVNLISINFLVQIKLVFTLLCRGLALAESIQWKEAGGDHGA